MSKNNRLIYILDKISVDLEVTQHRAQSLFQFISEAPMNYLETDQFVVSLVLLQRTEKLPTVAR